MTENPWYAALELQMLRAAQLDEDGTDEYYMPGFFGYWL